MTSRLTKQAKDAGTLEKFPEFPPREDMQNALHLYDDGHQVILRRFFGINDTTIILSEVPVRWTPAQREGHRIPDFLIAFEVDRPLAVEQNGYSIRDQGKPPDFVLEIASLTTSSSDLIDKRRDYANFGIPEYWRFDFTGGSRYDAPIAGDRLVNGAYHPVQIREISPEHLHGHSDALNLDPCWDHGKLRWYDPVSERHLLTLAEESEARIAAEQRVRELEEQLRAREES